MTKTTLQMYSLSNEENDIREIRAFLKQQQSIGVDFPGEHERIYKLDANKIHRVDNPHNQDAELLVTIKQLILNKKYKDAIELIDTKTDASHYNKDVQLSRKRKPNLYNKFVSNAMKEVSKTYPDLSSKMIMSIAVQMWSWSKNNPNASLNECMDTILKGVVPLH